MPYQHITTNKRTFKHLTAFDRGRIETYYKAGFTQQAIAERIGCSQATISRELKRGTTTQMTSQLNYYETYFAETGQARYNNHRNNCHAKGLATFSPEFFQALETELLDKSHPRIHSVDTFVHLYKKEHPDQAVPCTKTVYSYINQGKLKVRNIDLPRQTHMRPRKKKPSAPRGTNKKHLGRSIEERDQTVLDRENVGDWELDLVLGRKTADEPVLLTFLERKTRYFIVKKLLKRDANTITHAVSKIIDKLPGLVKTITTDNGSEFSTLSQLEDKQSIKVFFAHAYASWEKGSNERHNGLLREYIPKGHSLKQITYKEVQAIQDALNNRPRKNLDYHTPHELFCQAHAKLCA